MKTTLFTIILLVILSFTGCFLNSTSGNMVTPVIRAVGMPEADIIDSITLKITGPDMDDIEVRYSELPDLINIAVPKGNSRSFELTVSLVNSYTGPVVSYRGIDTIDITSEGSVVTLNMGIGSTKIVVPDAYNYRIVQIDNMSGTNWSTLRFSDMGFTFNYDFFPYDVDINWNGDILVANGRDDGTHGGIYTIEGIDFTSSTLVPPTYYAALDGNASVTAVAVDRKNKRVYGIAWGGVYYWDTPGDSTQLNTSGNPIGMAVDSEGNVYICGYVSTTGSFPWIVKYSYALSELETYIGGTAGSLNDITIQNGYLYALNNSGVAKIEVFDPDDLTAGPMDSYGTSGSTGTKGEFVGPHIFAAVLNKKLTIVDGTDYSAQLVSFDDILGTNWETYGSWDNSGNGTGVFKFFSNC